MYSRLRRPLRLALLTLLLGLFAVPAVQTADAQIGKRIKDRVQRDAERRVEDRAVAAARRTLDLAEDAIVCVVTDETCIADARKKGKEPVVVDREGKPVSGYEPAGTRTEPPPDPPSAAPGDGVWANYDFVSGDRILYVHDFEDTRTGNFPSGLDYLAGNLDVVRMGSGDSANKVLRVGEDMNERGGNGCFTIPLAETLPERFTLEFRVMTTDPQGRVGFELFSDGTDDSPDARCTYPPTPHLYVGTKEQGLKMTGDAKSGSDAGFETKAWTSVALGCDGPYCKMYVDGKRVANVPRYEFPRADRLHVFMRVYRYSLFLDDLRIAEGGPRSLYDDLESEGFISTTAIRFDTGSASIQPESSGILHDILALLEEHGDVRLRVEGHTDSQGEDDANQALSEARAEAVAAWLIDRGIDAGRLDTLGHGESQPAAGNDTAEGMAQNRRVVFRRM